MYHEGSQTVPLLVTVTCSSVICQISPFLTLKLIICKVVLENAASLQPFIPIFLLDLFLIPFCMNYYIGSYKAVIFQSVITSSTFISRLSSAKEDTSPGITMWPELHFKFNVL